MTDVQTLEVTNELFTAFLKHLVEEENASADDIIAIVAKPWNWSAEFTAWKTGRN